jgi:ABC-2 type transport system ATP-binding protein
VVTTESQYAIETVSLTKIFPDWWGRAKVVAVDDLNLRINHNEIYGFLGPNGSGKTTTLKMLLNLLHPTKGASFVYGGKISDTHISSRVGYLPEESYLYKYLTARETLNFYAQIFGLPRDVRKTRIETLLDMVGLSGMGNRQIGTFSKGMARRIGLAQALINDPDILILDEPTSGMDPMGTRQMKDLFVELAKRGKTVLLCSHLLADVEDVCDRIGILYGGKMQVEGTVQELLQQKNETQIRSERLSEKAVSKIQDIAASEGKSLEVTNPMDKLEGFFVKIVAKARQENLQTSGADSGKGISGFLADKPVVRSESVLDKLVTADVKTVPEKKPQASVETLKVEKPSSVPTADTNEALLQQLTKKAAEPVMTEAVAEETEIETPKPTVKKNMLDDLIGKKDEGTTEVTHPDQAEDAEDA